MRAKDRYDVMGSAHQKVHVCHESCAKLTYEVRSSLSYFYGAKIGVLGLNGSGKSSLLRILAGKDKDFNGESVIAPGDFHWPIVLLSLSLASDNSSQICC